MGANKLEAGERLGIYWCLLGILSGEKLILKALTNRLA